MEQKERKAEMNTYTDELSLFRTSCGKLSHCPFAYPAIWDSSTFAVRSCFVLSLASALL